MGIENDDWKERLVGFDFEVTSYDWLLVIRKYPNNEVLGVLHNDNEGVEDFLNEHDYIYVGYNNKHYDNYILKGILNGYDPEQIKEINDWIIVEHKNGWEYPYDKPFVKIPPTTDLMLDMPKRQSLKEIEGNLCMNIQESTVDFNIDHEWTKEEFEEMLFYCKHDVASTVKLAEERIHYLEAKAFNGTRKGLTLEQSLYKTNGQLASIALLAKKQDFDDERDIQFPDTVNWKNIPQEVIDFFNQIFDESAPLEVILNKKLKINFLGMEWTFAWGGVHASLENVIIEEEEGYLIIMADVTSLYPSLMEKYGLTSRAIPCPEDFFSMTKERVDAKERGDKETANKLKVPINTVYGISLQQFSDCYDPRNGRSVCVTGQLLLTDLCVELCKQCSTLKLNNVNTDGVGFKIHESELELAREIMKEWEERTHLKLEEDRIKKIVLKDVNNYIMEIYKDDGSTKLKCKGGYVANYPHGTFDSNSLSITHKAIVEYFINDIPVEDTINACDDPFEFQLIAKTGSTYSKTLHYVNGEEIEVQKVNRLYAVKDTSLGVVKKYKKTYLTYDQVALRRFYINLKGKKTFKKNWETDEQGDFFITKTTVQNCPPHALIDNSCQITIDTIDKSWYIELANKRINDFLGIKPEKKEKKKMAKKDEEVKVVEPRVALLQKIFQVGEILANSPWVMDGYNSHQSYEYVSSHKYREELGKACRTVGLLFKVNIGNRSFEKLEGSKMNLITIVGTMCFIDPNTGEHEDYMVMGDGTDNLDKGIYKAETLMVKYFVLNNFMLPKQQDEIDPENGKDDKVAAKEETKAKAPVNIVKEDKPKSKPATPKQREEAKERVVEDNFATESTVKEMIGIMDKIREVKSSYGEKTYRKLEDVLEGKEQLPKTEAVKMMSKFEERMDELGIE